MLETSLGTGRFHESRPEKLGTREKENRSSEPLINASNALFLFRDDWRFLRNARAS
jgi:hypothetical protein